MKDILELIWYYIIDCLGVFVLVDLKTGDLKHQDLGQMKMYVNYYDCFEKTEDENPTIEILLCKDKSEQMVELTLSKDSNIYASKYELYLPDKELLQEKLKGRSVELSRTDAVRVPHTNTAFPSLL